MMKIPVYQPTLRGNEKQYVNECLDSNWISSRGEFIDRFEKKFAEYICSRYSTSVCNGTVALHLALKVLNIQPGDEIIVPTFTYVASVNTILQCGAKPVFVDSLSSTWQIDPEAVLQHISAKTRAVMAVHLYGHPCNMSVLTKICREKNILLIEDCAEALGSLYQNQHVGTFGDVATFSFFGNKTLTTGEGGMLVTNNIDIYERAAHYKNQGASKTLHYWHDIVGYNYRMTNICAALGLAQLERLDEILQKKRQLANWYYDGLKNLPLDMHEEKENARHSYWMCSILLNDADHRDSLRKDLESAQIETRPLFYPVHLLPMYHTPGKQFPVAESLSSRGINLPSWPDLSYEQVKYICEHIRNYFVI